MGVKASGGACSMKMLWFYRSWCDLYRDFHVAHCGKGTYGDHRVGINLQLKWVNKPMLTHSLTELKLLTMWESIQVNIEMPVLVQLTVENGQPFLKLFLKEHAISKELIIYGQTVSISLHVVLVARSWLNFEPDLPVTLVSKDKSTVDDGSANYSIFLQTWLSWSRG